MDADFLLQIYPRLVEMMGLEDPDVRAAAVAVIYNYVEVDVDARERIASEKW